MRIEISSHDLSYEIIQDKGALGHLSDYLKLDRKVLIVTDDGVPAEYARTVASQCREAYIVTIPQGEASKNIDNWLMLLRRMLEEDFKRVDCAIAVGGGVCGDLTAFAASAYMRGIEFYNIPTTVLSMVDSSIGGKTAVDMDSVKNVIGSFYQPSAVIIDTEVLMTLDKRQTSSGLAEVIKMAATCDKETFELLERLAPGEDIDELIRRANTIKKGIVEQDPEEKGLRKVLNFGHTIGHAIESRSEGKLLHGECVGLGMLYMCTPEVRERIRNILEKFGLPTEATYDKEAVTELLKHDKKADATGINTVFCDSIGHYVFKKMTWDELRSLT